MNITLDLLMTIDRYRNETNYYFTSITLYDCMRHMSKCFKYCVQNAGERTAGAICQLRRKSEQLRCFVPERGWQDTGLPRWSRHLSSADTCNGTVYGRSTSQLLHVLGDSLGWLRNIRPDR